MPGMAKVAAKPRDALWPATLDVGNSQPQWYANLKCCSLRALAIVLIP